MTRFTIFISFMLWALSVQASSHLVELKEERGVVDLDELSWSKFKTDECNMFDTSLDNEESLRLKGLRRCRDGSVSFIQPLSQGAGGWEGKCGQTFGANSLYMFCQIAVNPSSYFKAYFRDITPGVRPSTVKRGMKLISKTAPFSNCFTDSNRWGFENARNAKDYIEQVESLLKARYSLPGQIEINRSDEVYINNPVGALVQNPDGKYLHWVTIVDMLKSHSSCYFVVNHWDSQYQVPCALLAKWSGKVGKTYPIILKSYSLITYK